MSRAPAILTPAYYERLDVLERRHWWCRSVRRVALDLIGRLAPAARVVLDAGCGTGGFLVALSARDSAILGVGADLSLDALTLARGHGLRHLIGASVLELPVASGMIDLVVSNDVLQHLPEGADARALGEARRVLKPGRFLCMRSNLGPPVTAGPSLHRRYDRDALSRLVSGAGFSIRRHIVLHPLAGLWSDLASGRASKHSDDHHGLALALPAEPVNAVIDLYTRAEDAIVSRLPLTLSLGDTQIVLAQKPAGA
jgi:SAM-dependent methyltransferase